MIKTHKESNRAKIITSGRKSVYFFEKCLFSKVLKIDTRIKFTQHVEHN